MDLHIDTVVRLECRGWTVDSCCQETINGGFDPHPFVLPKRLHSHERWLASTVEAVEIPPGFIGQIMLRSTWARLGLMAPPTYADPGFRGHLTMELFNCGINALLVRPGQAMWQIVYLPAPLEPLYEGRYQNQQAGPVLPKALLLPKES